MTQIKRPGLRNRSRILASALMVAAVLAAVLAAGLAYSAGPARAASTFTVTSISDSDDGACEPAGCSLREAIKAANAIPGADTIRFDVRGPLPVRTISPETQLPVITDAVTIDGYSQPGAAPNTLATGTNAQIRVQLDGTDAGDSADGLVIGASNVTVRGLAINRFQNSGILLSSSSRPISGVKIEGNFIGTDASGTLDRGNGRFGGILIGGFENGVNTSGGNNTVGGTSPFQRNLISGNDGDGVLILSTNNNKIEGNLIGTAGDGVTALGNDNGVDIGSSGNFVGGFSPSAANTIASNGADGVFVRASTLEGGGVSGNRVISNSVFSNARLGINLRGGVENAAGATQNDPKDPDGGANLLQNKPNLTSAVTASGKTTVQGRLNSSPSRIFLVHFYSNPSGNEGQKLLGTSSVTTNANGAASFTFSPAQAVAAGQNVTATATDVARGDTSEFSGPRTVTVP